jgi:protein translocase SecG subunit
VDFENYLNIAQIMISLLILLLILAQVKEAGGGLFGSAQATYRTRRGVEQTLFQFTIILIAIFLFVSIASVRIQDGNVDGRDWQVLIGAAAILLVASIGSIRLLR